MSENVSVNTNLPLNLVPIEPVLMQADPCDLCGPSSECVSSDIEGLPQCVCKSGYRGDGIMCNSKSMHQLVAVIISLQQNIQIDE